MADPCPCGSEIKPGQAEIAYITQTILDGASSVAPVNIITLMDPLYGRAVNLTALCASPPPRPPTSIAGWYENPIEFLDAILASVLSISWNLWCQCSTCPPVTTCGTGGAISLAPTDGYCPVSAQVPPPDPCAPCQVYYYVLDDGATYYAERSDGHCYGPFTGVEVRWPCATFAPPGFVTVANADSTGAITWLTSVYGSTLTLWTGGAGGAAPSWVWENGVATVDPPPDAPACDDTTICTAVEYVRDRVQVLERLMAYMYESLQITNASSTITLPGGGGALSGPLSEILAPAIQTLLPVLPAQLVDADPTVVTVSGPVDVTGRDFVAITLDVVPPYMGYRGVEAPIYYSNARGPGPGWVLLVGPDGVIEYHPLVYPQGIQMAVPPLATTLLIDLLPGVEITVTTYARNVVI